MKTTGEWWLDERTRNICINVTDEYEYYVPYDRLKAQDWSFHLSTKNWMTEELGAQFDLLRQQVLARFA
tara:strand:- start:2541 stop:2747 length:207 start_codon:yes stop_codon:yes gene_type:complete